MPGNRGGPSQRGGRGRGRRKAVKKALQPPLLQTESMDWQSTSTQVVATPAQSTPFLINPYQEAPNYNPNNNLPPRTNPDMRAVHPMDNFLAARFSPDFQAPRLAPQTRQVTSPAIYPPLLSPNPSGASKAGDETQQSSELQQTTPTINPPANPTLNLFSSHLAPSTSVNQAAPQPSVNSFSSHLAPSTSVNQAAPQPSVNSSKREVEMVDSPMSDELRDNAGDSTTMSDDITDSPSNHDTPLVSQSSSNQASLPSSNKPSGCIEPSNQPSVVTQTPFNQPSGCIEPSNQPSVVTQTSFNQPSGSTTHSNQPLLTQTPTNFGTTLRKPTNHSSLSQQPHIYTPLSQQISNHHQLLSQRFPYHAPFSQTLLNPATLPQQPSNLQQPCQRFPCRAPIPQTLSHHQLLNRPPIVQHQLCYRAPFPQTFTNFAAFPQQYSNNPLLRFNLNPTLIDQHNQPVPSAISSRQNERTPLRSSTVTTLSFLPNIEDNQSRRDVTPQQRQEQNGILESTCTTLRSNEGGQKRTLPEKQDKGRPSKEPRSGGQSNDGGEQNEDEVQLIAEIEQDEDMKLDFGEENMTSRHSFLQSCRKISEGYERKFSRQDDQVRRLRRKIKCNKETIEDLNSKHSRELKRRKDAERDLKEKNESEKKLQRKIAIQDEFLKQKDLNLDTISKEKISLEEQLEKNKKTLESTESTVVDLNKEVTDLKRIISEKNSLLHQKANAYTKLNDDLKKQILDMKNESKTEIDHLKKSLQDQYKKEKKKLEDSNIQKTEQIELLSHSLEGYKEENEKLLIETSEKIQELQDELTLKRQEFDEIKQKCDSKMAEVNKQVQTVKKNSETIVKKQAAELEITKSQLEDAKMEIDAKNKKLEELEQKCQTEICSGEQKNAEISNLRTNLEELKQEKEEERSKKLKVIEDFYKKVTEFEEYKKLNMERNTQEIREQAKIIEKQQNEIADLNFKNQELKASGDKNFEKYKQIMNDHDLLSSKIKTSYISRDEFSKKTSELKGQNECYVQQVASLKKTVDAQQDQITKHEQTISEQNCRIETQKFHIRNFEERCKKLDNELEKTIEEKNNLL